MEEQRSAIEGDRGVRVHLDGVGDASGGADGRAGVVAPPRREKLPDRLVVVVGGARLAIKGQEAARGEVLDAQSAGAGGAQLVDEELPRALDDSDRDPVRAVVDQQIGDAACRAPSFVQGPALLRGHDAVVDPVDREERGQRADEPQGRVRLLDERVGRMSGQALEHADALAGPVEAHQPTLGGLRLVVARGANAALGVGLVVHQEEVHRRRDGHGGLDRAVAERVVLAPASCCQGREVGPRGVAPGPDPIDVQVEDHGMVAQEADRGLHVVELGGEDDLVLAEQGALRRQAVVDARDGDAGAEQAGEEGAIQRPGAARPAAAVHVDHARVRTGTLAQPEVHQQVLARDDLVGQAREVGAHGLTPSLLRDGRESAQRGQGRQQGGQEGAHRRAQDASQCTERPRSCSRGLPPWNTPRPQRPLRRELRGGRRRGIPVECR